MKRIVLVEDEKLLAELLKRKLEEAGYEIALATNGQDGLNMIMGLKPDLILLDIVLPKLDGFEIMEAIQKNPEVNKIPIVVVSNSGQPVEIERIKQLGARDWLIKTEFDPQAVIQKVREQIG